MSSKAVGQQQQGRRTPLSLTGGKGHQSQQQQTQSNSIKANNNSNNHAAKNHDVKEFAVNKNSNQTAKHQHESKNLPSSQRETKKTQQNGSKHGTSNNDDDEIVSVEQNGTANGSNGNGISNKKNSSTDKPSNSALNKDKEKEKDKPESEIVKEKPEQKSKKSDTSKATEKKQNDAIEKQTLNVIQSSNSSKANDGASTPTPNLKENDEQNELESAPLKPSTPTISQQKSGTPSKSDEMEKPIGAPSKARTTSKSPKTALVTKAEKSQKLEKNGEVIEIKENEIKSLVVESSPPKKSVAKHAIAPTATSTPGKTLTDGKRGASNAKSDIQLTMETRRSVDRKSVPRSYSDISGRRSIRSSADFTPSMYNSQFRESYRRINTELDVTGITNTSMNVTVGSEIPNNSSFLSFSFFGRGRKRERTPPQNVPEKSQSAVELTTETTPPKRARLDVQGIFSVVSSPLTMLRTRFSKTNLDTPTKNEKLAAATDDVQNVSGISIEEVISSTEVTATENITVGKDAIGENTPSKSSPSKENSEGGAEKLQSNEDNKDVAMEVDGNIKIAETPFIAAVGEPKVKQKGCLLM